MRKAKRPLNPDAVQAANAALADETGGRQLTMGPEDGALRKKWMDAYLAAGGKADPDTPAGGASGGGSKPAAPCPIPEKCKYLDKPYLITAPKANFDENRGTYSLSKPSREKHTFPGDTAPQDADVYTATVDGRNIKIITPATPPAGKSVPTADELASSLATLPGKQLDSIHEVQASPNPNPSDSFWATQYNIPGFTSAATGGDGGVTYYPQNKSDYWNPQEEVDRVMNHEGAHTLAGDLWKDPDEKKAWADAVKKDPFSPSKYADSSIDEDFAESVAMYNLSKGTECEAIARKRYPERYKILDNLFHPMGDYPVPSSDTGIA
jgi:hypothetical protein